MLFDRKILFLTAIVSLALSGCVSQQKVTDTMVEVSTVQETQETSVTSQTEKTGKSLGSYTDEELIKTAQDMFDEACSISVKYLTGSVYSTDSAASTDIDGKQAFRVNDFMVAGADDIKNQWLTVFSDKYSAVYQDMFAAYKEKDGSVWAVRTPYTKVDSYKQSSISKIVNRADNEIEFTAVSAYTDPSGGPDTIKETPFSLIYEDDTFYIGKFVLPY